MGSDASAAGGLLRDPAFGDACHYVRHLQGSFRGDDIAGSGIPLGSADGLYALRTERSGFPPAHRPGLPTGRETGAAVQHPLLRHHSNVALDDWIRLRADRFYDLLFFAGGW